MSRRKSMLPPSKTLSIYMTDELKDEIDKIADSQNRSTSSLVCIVMQKFVENTLRAASKNT